MTYERYFGQKRKRGLISLRRKQMEILIFTIFTVNSAIRISKVTISTINLNKNNLNLLNDLG